MAKLRDQREVIHQRKEHLRRLCANRFGNNQTQMAEAAGLHASQIHNALSDNEKHGRPIGDSLARRIEAGLGIATGYLDQPLEVRPSDARLHDLLALAAELEEWGWEEDAQTLRDLVGDLGKRYSVEFDGFVGSVVGTYRRHDGEEGVVMQHDGTRMVHIYRRQHLTPLDAPETPPPPLPEWVKS